MGTAMQPVLAVVVGVYTPGYRMLLRWAQRFGPVLRAGWRAPGPGAGLTRALLYAGVEVMEVTRPDRRDRRMQGKLTRWTPKPPPGRPHGTATGQPKTRDGRVEAIRR